MARMKKTNQSSLIDKTLGCLREQLLKSFTLAFYEPFAWTPDGLIPREAWSLKRASFPSIFHHLRLKWQSAWIPQVSARNSIKKLALVKCLRRNLCFHQEMAITWVLWPAKVHSGEEKWSIVWIFPLHLFTVST